MRVAIAYPPLKSEKGVALLTQNRQFQWFSRPTYIFPVVPATAATMLKRAGHDVLFLDGIAAELDEGEFERRLAEFAPDFVVIETKTPVVKRHWQWAAAHDYKVIMVGDHVTALPEESIARPGVWAIVPGGDWDYGLVDFLNGDRHRGVYPFALRENLKDLPWIDRDLVHWELYAKRNGNFRRTPGTYIMAGRDCWHAKCTFCSWTTLYPKYRTRDPIDVVDEIEMLVSKYGVREIMDDSGSFPVGEWLTAFCNEMIRRGLPKRVRIDCNMRFGRLKFDDYRLMRKAGFRLVLFGVESANQSTLDRFVKALKVEDVIEGCKWANDAGLAVHLTFMFGHAWEGKAEIENTVRLARRLLANGWASTLQCTLTVPYPGTPLFKELQATDGLTTLDWDEYDQRRAITKTPLVTEGEIKCAVRRVYRGFLQPAALLHLLRRNLFDFGFYYRGFRYLMGHLLDFRSVVLVLSVALSAAALAEKVEFNRYQSVIDRQMFGPLPPNFDPTKSPSEVSKTEQKELTKEQEKLKSAIHFSVINVESDGAVAVGFTDRSDPQSQKHYYLRSGEERDGWKVTEANAETATMKIVKNGVEVTLTIGGDSAKDAAATARTAAAAPADGAANSAKTGSGTAPSAGNKRLFDSLRTRRLDREKRKQEEAALRLKQEQEAKERDEKNAAETAALRQELHETRAEMKRMQTAQKATEAKAATQEAKTEANANGDHETNDAQ